MQQMSYYYETINTRFRDVAVQKQLFSEDGALLYSGFAVRDTPYGSGTVFYPDGKIYQEGVFGIKGLLYGREYYPSGKIRFEGVYAICMGYGPNYPIYGKCYDTEGNQFFNGKLKIRHSGLGYPTVEEPEQYGNVHMNDRPHYKSFSWSDAQELDKRINGE